MTTKKLILLVACFLIVSSSKGQKVYHLTKWNSCFFTDVRLDKPLDILPDPASVQSIDFVNQILDQVTLSPRFNIYAGKLYGRTAIAHVEQQTRIIFVDEQAIEKIKKDMQSSWPEVFTIAHECAHHMNRDTEGDPATGKESELRADKFAGYVLYKLGATRNQMLLALKSLNYQNSDTHPPIEKRIDAASAGWEKAYKEAPDRLQIPSGVKGTTEERYALVKDVFSIMVKENPIDKYARWELVYNYIPVNFSVENYVVRNGGTTNHTFNVKLSAYQNKPVIWFNAFVSCDCVADIDVPSGTVINNQPQTFRLINFRRSTAKEGVSGQCIGLNNMYYAGGWKGNITLSVDNAGNINIGNFILEVYRSADRFSPRSSISYSYTANNVNSNIWFEDKP